MWRRLSTVLAQCDLQEAARIPSSPDSLPLSALLSKTLVAYTVEADDLFELEMVEAGRERYLSLAGWLNWLRFVTEDGITVAELARRPAASFERAAAVLGCLERWHLVVLEADPGKPARAGKAGRRQGFGSMQGVGRNWTVRPASAGRLANEIWPGALEEVERRWPARFGADTTDGLREELSKVVESFDSELPWALPSGWLGQPDSTPGPRPESGVAESGVAESGVAGRPLGVLLAQALRVWALEFDGESRLSIGRCANTLRVLTSEGVRAGELARLTGLSPEMSDIDWQLKGLAEEVPGPARRGKLVRLTERGSAVQRRYQRLSAEIEQIWEERHGAGSTGRLRALLGSLYEPGPGGTPRISEGLQSPAGVRRSGGVLPSLGRSRVTATSARRARQLAEQSVLFRADPLTNLPHFPLWDGNRGFGP
jgi:hypothetical protein